MKISRHTSRWVGGAVGAVLLTAAAVGPVVADELDDEPPAVVEPTEEPVVEEPTEEPAEEPAEDADEDADGDVAEPGSFNASVNSA